MRLASHLYGGTCSKDHGFHSHLREADNWPRWTSLLSNRTEFHVVITRHSLERPLALLTLAALKEINTPGQDQPILMIPGEAEDVKIPPFPPTPRKIQFPMCHLLCFHTSGGETSPLHLTTSRIPALWEMATAGLSPGLREFIPLKSGKWVNIYSRLMISDNV